MPLTITINGEPKNYPRALSIRDLLTGLGLDPAKIAVERNLEIVPRSQYATVMAGEGDRFEIVHFIGGGNNELPLPSREGAGGRGGDALPDKPLVIAGK